MKRSIRVSVELADISRYEADVIALMYTGGLVGATLTVAKAVGKTGPIMQQLLPSVGSVSLLPGMGRIKAKQALFLRVVQYSSLDYNEIGQFSFSVLKGLRDLAPETRHLAVTVHGPGFGLDVSKSLQAEVLGCVEAVRAGDYPPSLERISIVEVNRDKLRSYQVALSALLPGHKIELSSPLGPGRDGGEAMTEPAAALTEEIDVFISYKSEDSPYAEEVYDFLKARGLKVFFSRESLPALGSTEYHEQIDRAVERAHHMVVVTTSGEHVMAKWVSYEWRLFLGEMLASRKKGNLVTVIFGGMDIDELPIGLRHREVIRFLPGEREKLVLYLKAENG